MRKAPIPPDDPDRLAALAEYGPLRRNLDPQLDAIVALARQLFDVPTALVSLVTADAQLFVAREGLDSCGTPRDISFCGHAIGSDDLLVVPDASLDARFADNPLVTDPPHVRFYAGAPLRTPTGYVIGTLCIVDARPRTGFAGRDRKALRGLAGLVLERLELRRLAAAAEFGEARFRLAAATSPEAIVCADRDGAIRFRTDAAARLLGSAAAEAIGGRMEDVLPGLEDLHRGSASGDPLGAEVRHSSGRMIAVELSPIPLAGLDASTAFVLREAALKRQALERLHALASGGASRRATAA